MQGKKAIIKSSFVILSNKLSPPLIGYFDGGKKVIGMVSLAEVILYIVVLGRNPQLNEFLLKSAGLLKEAMYLSFYFHFVL